LNVVLNEDTINKEQNISIRLNTDIKPYKSILHFDIPTWLWYSPNNIQYEKPSVTNRNCLTHPCSNLLFQLKGSKLWAGTGTGEKENNVSKYTIDKDIKQNNIKNNNYHKINW
jgi:hypothetical protein